MTDNQFEELKKQIERTRKEASDKGHMFIIGALIILLFRGC